MSFKNFYKSKDWECESWGIFNCDSWVEIF